MLRMRLACSGDITGHGRSRENVLFVSFAIILQAVVFPGPPQPCTVIARRRVLRPATHYQRSVRDVTIAVKAGEVMGAHGSGCGLGIWSFGDNRPHQGNLAAADALPSRMPEALNIQKHSLGG
jgi:hypothetical protein